MSLLKRIAPNDSIHQMEVAREDRYWDAFACCRDDRAFGACYLLGYVVEMSLKTAYFRFLDLPPGADIKPLLRDAGRSPLFRNRRRNLHDLLAWAELLVDTRDNHGRRLDPALAGTLMIRVGEVAWNWSEVMRYREAVEAGEEANRFFKAVEWILEHHKSLWS